MHDPLNLTYRKIAIGLADRKRLEYIRACVYPDPAFPGTFAGALGWALERGARYVDDPVYFNEPAGGQASLHTVTPCMVEDATILARVHGSASAGVRWALRVAERAIREGLPEYQVDPGAEKARVQERDRVRYAKAKKVAAMRRAERRGRWRRVQLEGEAYSAALYAQRHGHAPAPEHSAEREREQAAVKAEQARLEAERAAELEKNLAILCPKAP
jgi:hypothetical protein